MTNKTLIAKWQSGGGAYVAELYKDARCRYEVQAGNYFSYLPPFKTDLAAVEYMEMDLGWGDGKRRIDIHQPDANKTPMQRVFTANA